MKKTIISWSGGKDCCFAMHKAKKEGYEAVCLLTSMPTNEDKTFGHSLELKLLQKQAKSLGIPLEIVRFENGSYTEAFVQKLMELKKKYKVEHITFGDIYLEEHKQWGVDVCKKVAMLPLYPLWIEEQQRYELLEEFIQSGYKTIIMKIRKSTISLAYLGRPINTEFANYIGSTEFCPLGEAGEYHTIVVDGPMFQKPLDILLTGADENEQTYFLKIKGVE